MVVGQKRFVSTMRRAGADMKELKEVNRQAAGIALPAVQARTPRGKTGKLARTVRAGATQKAGVIRAGRKAVPYAGVINYGWAPRPPTSGAASSSTRAWPRPKAPGSSPTNSSSTKHSAK